jgi:hypothetical protein
MTEKKFVREQRKDVYFPNVLDTEIIEGFNIRTDYGDLSELVELFKKTPDKIPPATGYKKNGKYVLTDGHRRRAAAIIAAEQLKAEVLEKDKNAKEFPVVTIGVMPEAKGYKDIDRLTDMFVRNEGGKKLSLLEHAEGVRRYIEEYKFNEHEIATRIRKSVTYVRNCIKLKSAPEDIQQLMADEFVSPTLIVSMFKEHDLDKAAEIIRDTVYGNKSESPDRKNQMAIDFKAEAEVVFPLSFEEGGGNGGSAEQGGSRLNITPEIVVAPEVKDEPKPTPRKITKKDIDDNLKKENSIGHFKKVIKRSEQEPVNEEKADEFMFIQRLIMGEVNEKEIARRYFNGKVVDVENF